MTSPLPKPKPTTPEALAAMHQACPEGDNANPALHAVKHVAYHQALATNLLDQAYVPPWVPGSQYG